MGVVCVYVGVVWEWCVCMWEWCGSAVCVDVGVVCMWGWCVYVGVVWECCGCMWEWCVCVGDVYIASPHNSVSFGHVVSPVVLLQHNSCLPHALEPAPLEKPSHPPLDEDDLLCECSITHLLKHHVICILGRRQSGDTHVIVTCPVGMTV